MLSNKAGHTHCIIPAMTATHVSELRDLHHFLSADTRHGIGIAMTVIHKEDASSPPAASFAWRAFLAPGMGTAPLQMVQLIATCNTTTNSLN